MKRTMAEPGLCVRVTRAAKKRDAAGAFPSPEPFTATKKRMVLGELPNLSNVMLAAAPMLQKPKCSTRSKKSTALRSSKQDDPQICSAYADDIYEYLHHMEIELKRRPLPSYLDKVQNDITATMRGMLVDWLVEVAEEYKLLADTLFLTISYIDKFLSSNILGRQKLQLLGVSSMLIASKYEEISPPHVEDFCYITDNTYNKDEVVNMEADILKALKFEVGNPTIKTFLRKLINLAHESDKAPNLQLEFLGCYLAELSLLDYNCVKFLSSMVAASVVFLARFMIQPKLSPWNSVLQRHSRYKATELKECIQIIHSLYLNRKGGGLQAIRDKYKQQKYKCVAAIPSPPEIPAYYFEDVKE